jgi:hypothetical protein
MDTPAEANARFNAFTSEVKDTGRIWVLHNCEGYAQWSSEDKICFPIWSQQITAEGPLLVHFPITERSALPWTHFEIRSCHHFATEGSG